MTCTCCMSKRHFLWCFAHTHFPSFYVYDECLLNASFRFVSLHCFQRNQLGVQCCVDLWSLFIYTCHSHLKASPLMEYKLIERLSQLIIYYWNPRARPIKKSHIWTLSSRHPQYIFHEYSKKKFIKDKRETQFLCFIENGKNWYNQ